MKQVLRGRIGAAQITPALLVWRLLNYYIHYLLGPVLGGPMLIRRVRKGDASPAD